MKIITIIGARPQFIKAAMVSRAIIEFNQKHHKVLITEKILHSGQHYDNNMSQIFFDQLGIPQPFWILNGKNKSIEQLSEMIYPVIKKENPDWVLLYGDTNTTAAGAIAAEHAQCKIIHVEAGLRSFNSSMSEEKNRIATDHKSTLLFCPTTTAKNNLYNEHITGEIFQVGDVMYDAALFFAPIAECYSNILPKLHITPKHYNLATVHRAENTDDHSTIEKIITAFTLIATPDKPIVWPIHPRTQHLIKSCKSLQNLINSNNSIITIDPVSFIDMISLESSAYKILTDSGGIQKEAYFHKIQCITLRNETEWTETITAHWNILAGIEPQNILEAYNKNMIPNPIDEYGIGKSAEKIVEIIWQKRY